MHGLCCWGVCAAWQSLLGLCSAFPVTGLRQGCSQSFGLLWEPAGVVMLCVPFSLLFSLTLLSSPQLPKYFGFAGLWFIPLWGLKVSKGLVKADWVGEMKSQQWWELQHTGCSKLPEKLCDEYNFMGGTSAEVYVFLYIKSERDLKVPRPC